MHAYKKGWLTAAVIVSFIGGLGCVFTQKAMNRTVVATCEVYESLALDGNEWGSNSKNFGIISENFGFLTKNLDEEMGSGGECSGKNFNSPIIQLLLGATGALGCWGVYLLERRAWSKSSSSTSPTPLDFIVHQSSLEKPLSGRWIWVIPAIFEFLASYLCNVAFGLTFASTVLMLRSFSTAIVALITAVWIKTPLTVYNWAGVAVITLGTMIASLFASLNPDPSAPSETKGYLGVAAAIMSCVFTSLKVCSEEKLLKEYRIAPFKAAGLQGVYHFVFGFVFIICTAGNRENFRESIFQISHSKRLRLLALLFTFNIFIFNGSLIVISKLANSLLRTILHAFRTVLVFLIELGLGWTVLHTLDSVSIITSTTGLLLYINFFKCRQCDRILTGYPANTSAAAPLLQLTNPLPEDQTFAVESPTFDVEHPKPKPGPAVVLPLW